MNLSDFISTITRVTSVKYKKFLLGSFSVAKFGIAELDNVTVSMESAKDQCDIISQISRGLGHWANLVICSGWSFISPENRTYVEMPPLKH